jgi:hypothetical protein
MPSPPTPSTPSTRFAPESTRIAEFLEAAIGRHARVGKRRELLEFESFVHLDQIAIEAKLSSNLYKLWNRLSSGSYFPPPVRRVMIPKAGGAGERPVTCKWALLYIERWLTAPMEHPDGMKVERTRGTPQGGVVSPISG